MDFPELMALLEYHTLFFPKSTKLGSKYEGEYSYAEEEWNKIIYKDKIPNDTICKVLKDNKSYNKLQRECVYINCWHIMIMNQIYYGTIILEIMVLQYNQLLGM